MWVWILFVLKIANVCTQILILGYLQCFTGTVTSAVMLLMLSINEDAQNVIFNNFSLKYQSIEYQSIKTNLKSVDRLFSISIDFYTFPWLNFSFIASVKLRSLNAVWMIGVFQDLCR